MNKGKLLGVIFLLLISCERWFESEHKVSSGPTKKSNLVLDQWLISEVMAGDVVHFEIKVIESSEQFSKVYSKVVDSFWESRKCNKKVGGGILCGSWRSNMGSCKALYRDFLGYGERFMDLSRPAIWPFKLTVGRVRYILDNDYTVGPTTLKGKLTITEKMTARGDDLAIEVIQAKPRDVHFGFLGFNECEGEGQRNFVVDASIHYEIVEQDSFRELSVTIRR